MCCTIFQKQPNPTRFRLLYSTLSVYEVSLEVKYKSVSIFYLKKVKLQKMTNVVVKQLVLSMSDVLKTDTVLLTNTTLSCA